MGDEGGGDGGDMCATLLRGLMAPALLAVASESVLLEADAPFTALAQLRRAVAALPSFTPPALVALLSFTARDSRVAGRARALAAAAAAPAQPPLSQLPDGVVPLLLGDIAATRPAWRAAAIDALVATALASDAPERTATGCLRVLADAAASPTTADAVQATLHDVTIRVWRQCATWVARALAHADADGGDGGGEGGGDGNDGGDGDVDADLDGSGDEAEAPAGDAATEPGSEAEGGSAPSAAPPAKRARRGSHGSPPPAGDATEQRSSGANLAAGAAVGLAACADLAWWLGADGTALEGAETPPWWTTKPGAARLVAVTSVCLARADMARLLRQLPRVYARLARAGARATARGLDGGHPVARAGATLATALMDALPPAVVRAAVATRGVAGYRDLVPLLPPPASVPPAALPWLAAVAGAAADGATAATIPQLVAAAASPYAPPALATAIRSGAPLEGALVAAASPALTALLAYGASAPTAVPDDEPTAVSAAGVPLPAAFSAALCPWLRRDAVLSLLGDVLAHGKPAGLSPIVARAIGVPRVAPPAPLELLVEAALTRADGIASRSDLVPADRTRALLEVTALFFGEGARATYTEEVLRGALTRLIDAAIARAPPPPPADDGDAAAAATPARPAVPLLLMRTVLLAAQHFPDSRGIFIGQLSTLLDRVGDAVFEPLAARQAWADASGAEGAGEARVWDSFVHVLKKLAPLAFMLMA